MSEYAEKLVADWPPLTQAQRDRLAGLLRSSDDRAVAGSPVTPEPTGGAA